jgi:hypothetical protein
MSRSWQYRYIRELVEKGYTQLAKNNILDVTPYSISTFHEEPDGTCTITDTQDVQPVLDSAKRKYNDYGGKLTPGKRGEWHQVASIPVIVWDAWIKETNGAILKDKKLLSKKLNDAEFQYFKTSPTTI